MPRSTNEDGSGGAQEAPETLRADARRNREQIIEAARTLFARLGADVPMEEIAREAGVGVGTLYRRFPDRGELLKAVNLDSIGRLAELARQAEREPDAAAALISLLRSALETRLSSTLTTLPARTRQAIVDSPPVVEQRAELIAVAGRLLRRAQDSGAIRPDIGIGDVVMVLTLTSRLVPPSGDELGDMAVKRMFALMVDGLRAVPGSALPGRPVEHGDVEELRHRRP